MKIRLLFGGLAALVLIALAVRPSVRVEAGSVPARDVLTVRVGQVGLVDSNRARSFSGTLRAAKSGRLAFTITGRVAALPVEPGQHVKQGQTLAQLDLAPLRNQVGAAEADEARLKAQLAQGQRDERRAEELLSGKAIPVAVAEEASSGVEVLTAAHAAAQVQLQEAQRLLREATLRAPFAGVVTSVDVEAGEIAVAGRPVVVLEGGGALELEVEVPEELLAQLPPDLEVQVSLPRRGDQRVEGRVSEVTHAMPERGKLFPVVIQLLSSEGLTPGMSAQLELGIEAEATLGVPVESVVNPGGTQAAVFRVVGDHVEKVDVEPQGLWQGRALVRGELAEGDRVVTSGHHRLTPGATVEVLR